MQTPTNLSRGRIRAALFSGPVLLIAFAFAVMADPVSSVAYAIEAAGRPPPRARRSARAGRSSRSAP